jgi:hypothetical protein
LEMGQSKIFQAVSSFLMQSWQKYSFDHYWHCRWSKPVVKEQPGELLVFRRSPWLPDHGGSHGSKLPFEVHPVCWRCRVAPIVRQGQVMLSRISCHSTVPWSSCHRSR